MNGWHHMDTRHRLAMIIGSAVAIMGGLLLLLR